MKVKYNKIFFEGGPFIDHQDTIAALDKIGLDGWILIGKHEFVGTTQSISEYSRVTRYAGLFYKVEDHEEAATITVSGNYESQKNVIDEARQYFEELQKQAENLEISKIYKRYIPENDGFFWYKRNDGETPIPASVRHLNSPLPIVRFIGSEIEYDYADIIEEGIFLGPLEFK